MTAVQDLYRALAAADAVVIATDHSAYDWRAIQAIYAGKTAPLLALEQILFRPFRISKPLFLPRISVIVIAAHFPKTGAIFLMKFYC